MSCAMKLRSGRKVGEQQSTQSGLRRGKVAERVPPREVVVVPSKTVVPSKKALWEMGCRVTFPLVELVAEIERCASPSWEQLKDFLYRFTDIDEEEVTPSLASEEGVKVYAYSVEWRAFINELLTKVDLALNKGYVAFLKERGCGGQVLGTEPGTRVNDRLWWTAIMERHQRYYRWEVMSRAYDLPGYVRETGRRSVRKVASGAGSD